MTNPTIENVALLALHIGKLTLQRDYAQAIEAANVAILAYPKCAGLYAQRGQLYVLVERDDLARLDFDTMVQLQPTAARYLRRAGFFMQTEETMEAMQDCYEALRLEPGNRHAEASLQAAQVLMEA